MIREDTEKDENGERSPGKIVFSDPSGKAYRNKYMTWFAQEWGIQLSSDYSVKTIYLQKEFRIQV